MPKEVVSACIYCGCGCKLRYLVENNKVVRVLPYKEDEVSRGSPCVKGLTIHEVIEKNRVLKPMIRESKDDEFKEVSWEKAYEFIYEHTHHLAPCEVLFIPSGKISNEDNYVMQKFARIVFGTNNVDGCCNRLCHANTTLALEKIYGTKGIPSRTSDVLTRDVVLVISSNPASNYPMLFGKMLAARRGTGLKILTVVSLLNETAKMSDKCLVIRPGTDLMLLNGISNYIIQHDGVPESSKEIEGYDGLRKVFAKYTPERVSSVCDISVKEFIEFSEIIRNSKNFGAMHGMGLTQVKKGYENVLALLNLVLLKNGAFLTNRGEINVQGMVDMGCTPDGFLSPYLVKEEVERAWGAQVPDCLGLNMIKALYLMPAKAVFACDVNIAVSMPDLNRLYKNLKDVFLVYMHHHKNYTMKFANVLLPIPMLIEGEGTITTSERRVRYVGKVLDPPGMAKPVWLVLKELSRFYGKEKYFEYKNEKVIFKEIARVILEYREIDPDKVYSGVDGWTDKTIEYKKYTPVEYKGIDAIVSEKYPFMLVTVRSPAHFLHDELTSLSNTLRKTPSYIDYCFLSKIDAEKINIEEGNEVIIKSSVGKIMAKAKIDPSVPPRVVKLYIHSQEVLINKLVPLDFTPETFTPNYKVVAVNVEPKTPSS